LAHDVGIGFGGNFIFGDIAETPGTLCETMNFFFMHCLDIHIYFASLNPYPGSSLFNHCLRHGIIADKVRFYENIDKMLYNMTTMPSTAWADWIRTVVWPLNQAQFTVSIEPLEVSLYQSPTASNCHTPLWRIKARCPHCSKIGNYSEPYGDDEIARGNSKYITGCKNCGKRFKVAIRGEGLYGGGSAQREIAPKDLQTIIQHAIFELVKNTTN
jgi:hypothetical protein